MGEDQLPPRFEPGFDQGNHPLDVEVKPTLSTTDDIEGLGVKFSLFCGTGRKMHGEMFLGSEVPGSGNLCLRDVNGNDAGTVFGKCPR